MKVGDIITEVEVIRLIDKIEFVWVGIGLAKITKILEGKE